MAPRSFSCSLSEKKTRDADRPGPQYDIPSGLSRQIESHKWSQNTGRFGASERKTFDVGKERSPGPAAYDTRPPPVKEERSASGKPSAKLMGSATRFFPSPPDDKSYPGPGNYRLKPTVGGMNPSLHSAPVVGFSKACLRDQKMIDRSPGPIYDQNDSVGTSIRRKSDLQENSASVLARAFQPQGKSCRPYDVGDRVQAASCRFRRSSATSFMIGLQICKHNRFVRESQVLVANQPGYACITDSGVAAVDDVRMRCPVISQRRAVLTSVLCRECVRVR